MKKFFPFLSTSTTLLSLFLGVFAIAVFVNMLFGTQFDMLTVHTTLTALPNPFEFISEGMRLYNYVFTKWYVPQDLSLIATGSNIFDAIIKFFIGFVAFVRWIVSFILMVFYFLVVGPIYCIWFLLRTIVVFLKLAGVNTDGWTFINGNWGILGFLPN